MFKKRLFALFLAAGMLVFPFAAGCGEQPQEPPAPEVQEPEKEPETPEKPEKPEEVFALALDRERYFLAETDEGASLTPSATLTRNGEAFGGTVTYAVADGTVASLTDGKLIARAAGKTTLTATYTPETGDAVTDTAAVEVLGETSAEKVNAFATDGANLLGRTYFKAGRLQLDNVCTGFEVAFYGTELALKLRSVTSMFVVFLDGSAEGTPLPTERKKSINLVEGLEKGVHTVRVIKAASPMVADQKNCIEIETSPLSTDGRFLKPPAKSDLKIEFIGDSITEAYGATGRSGEGKHTLENSLATASYAYLTAQNLNADYSIIALNGICVKDGATNMYDKYLKNGFHTSGDYDFSSFEADVVVLALGENDMWHATSDKFPNYNTELFQKDYADMLRLIREKRPNAQIVCIYGMMPASATLQTKQIVTAAIADTGDEKITQIQMISNAAGAASHPNAQAHIKTATTLTAHIRSLLQ